MTDATDLLLSEARRLAPALLALVDGDRDGDSGEAGLEQAQHRLKRAKSRVGAAGLGAALGLDPRNELGVFEGILKDLADRAGRVGDASKEHNVEERNLRIATLRFLDFCALISHRLDRPELAPRYEPSTDEQLGRRQLRALELLVRSLVNETADGQETLRQRLEAAFGAERVQTWMKTADPGDLLSGTTFSELVSIFVDKDAFRAHHEPLFEETRYLRYLRNKRETIRSFLEDVRRLRNIVAHNRRISPVQLALLDHYYEELAEPVGEAFRSSRTTVDPQAFMQVSGAQLDGWFNALKEDVGAIREDLRGLTGVTRGIDLRTRFIELSTRLIDRRTQVISVGVKALLVATVLGALIPLWEVVLYVTQRWEARALAGQYAGVADEIYHRENNPTVAQSLIERAIALDPGNPRLQTSKAYMDGMAAVRELLNLDRPLFKEELDRAHTALASAAWLERLDGSQPEPHILRGQIYMALDQKRDDLARAAFERAVAIAPRNVFALMRLAALKQRAGDAEGALALLDRALEIDPRDKWSWLWRGIVHADTLKQWDKAREDYARALEIDSRFDLAHYNIGWTWINQPPADYARALESFERVLQINPNYKEAYHAIGFAFANQRQYEVAKFHYNRALQLDPNYVTAWKWRAVINQDMGLRKEALADFARAMELSPRDPDLYVRRARTYQLDNQNDQAIADLTFASQLRPGIARIWTTLGDVYRRTHQHTAAIESYGRALEINPKDEVALMGRAESRGANGDQDGARKDFSAAFAAVNYRPERIWLRRGQFNQQYGDHEQALDDFRQARKAAPRDFESCLAEAALLVQLVRIGEADDAIASCRRLRPQDTALNELRGQLQLLIDRAAAEQEGERDDDKDAN